MISNFEVLGLQLEVNFDSIVISSYFFGSEIGYEMEGLMKWDVMLILPLLTA